MFLRWILTVPARDAQRRADRVRGMAAQHQGHHLIFALGQAMAAEGVERLAQRIVGGGSDDIDREMLLQAAPMALAPRR